MIRTALFPRFSTPALVRAALHRLPFTLSVVATILAVTAVTGAMVRPITPALLERWGFALDDLRAGRLYLLLLTPFQAYRPYMVLTISASLLLFLSAAEYVLGTRRAALVFWVTHFAGYVGAFLLVWPFAAAGYGWAERVVNSPDVGASAAGFGAAGAVIPFLPAAWRRPAFTGLALYLLSYLAADRRIWDIEHVIAFATGLLLGMVFLRRRGEPWPSLIAWPHIGRRQRPAILAWAVGVMGFINVLSAFVSPRHRGLIWLEENLPLSVPHAARHLTLMLGFALLLLAFGLARARRQAWQLAVVVVAGSVALHLTKGADLPEAVLAAGLLLWLFAWRDAYAARTDPASLRQGYLFLLLLSPALPLYGVVGFYILRHQYAEVYTVAAALKETGARLLFANAGEYAPLTRRARWFLDSIPVLGWSGAAYVIVMLLRAALAPRPTVSDLERAQQLLIVHGRGGTSYMTLWEPNAVFFGPGQASYVGYRLTAGVALALGDPIGLDELVRPTIAAFARFCDEQGWEHAFYAAGPRALPVYEALGYRALKIGEEAVLPLQELEFKGKAWQDVRTALNRATREGISFQMHDGGAVPALLREQLIAISGEWLKKKGLPEMRFTLGTIDDIDDPNVLVAVAVDSAGKVHGFVDWLPMYGASGWVIDLMRRRPDAFGGVMEFLIGSSLLALKERGYRVVSLATAPLANLSRDEQESSLQKALGFVYEHLDTFYNFQSLLAFKKKFQPRWEGVYLVYHTPAELPRIILAILRAYLPELGPRVVADLVGSTVAERLTRPAVGLSTDSGNGLNG